MIRILLGLSLLLAAGPALADRAATPRERAAIEKTLAAEGCRASDDMEFIEEDNIFELDNVSCRDGRLWEYDIGASFNVIDKQPQEAGEAGEAGEEDDDDEEDGPDDGDDGPDDDDEDDDD